MSPKRDPPPFPQPFVPTVTGSTNPPPYTTGTSGQRPIGHVQGSAQPPEIHGYGGTPNVWPPPIPPRPSYPSGHLPASQPIQGSVQPRPAFPMPQVQHPHAQHPHAQHPHVQHPHAPPTSGPPLPPPPPPIAQWSESTRMPSHPHNTQVVSGPYSSTSLQVPSTVPHSMPHSLSQRDSGMSGAAHVSSRVPRNQDEGHMLVQGFPATYNDDFRSKGPPKYPASSVRICSRANCTRPCPSGQVYCSARCQSGGRG